ncbi:oxidoreductase, partial [Marivirga lumbricoides]
IADIGTHAFNLLESVTGMKVDSLCADVSALVKGRAIDDDANILVKMENGAKGTLSVSQISTGEDNDFSLHIYGDKAGLVWRHTIPYQLHIKYPDFTEDIIQLEEKNEETTSEVNIPGHSPYFTEGFQNIYNAFFQAIESKGQATEETFANTFSLPLIEDGVRGMLFIDKAIESSDKQAWVKLDF